MVSIEVIPGIWFEVDPRKIALPQDGQRLISFLQESFKNCLVDWVGKNYARARETAMAEFWEMNKTLLEGGEILHEFATTFTPISTKRRIAAVTWDKDGKEIHFGNWYSKQPVDLEN